MYTYGYLTQKLLSYTKYVPQASIQNWGPGGGGGGISEKYRPQTETCTFPYTFKFVLQLPFITPVCSLPAVAYSTETISVRVL